MEKKGIYCLLILTHYFVDNFGFHYPLELIQMIMECYHRDIWIEHKFTSPRFGKTISVDVPMYGYMIDINIDGTYDNGVFSL